MNKGLKNYTTSISAQRTIAEIEDILAKHGATDIWKQYDGAGNTISLNFVIPTEFGKMPFKLPVNVEAVSQVLKNQRREGKISISKMQAQDLERARNVGWRIIKDWIESQLAIVEVNLVKIEQVFLPYAYDPVRDRTLYESLRERKFAGLLMAAQEQKQ